jgi:hypothetical protein
VSSRKPKRAGQQVVRDPAEYVDAFHRHWRLLRTYCEQYDAGNVDAALPISLSLRVLLHAGSGKPLLGQVMNLKHLRLIDSASYWGRSATTPLGLGAGLVRLQATTPLPGQPATPGRVLPAYGSPPDGGGQHPNVVFRDWWDRDRPVGGWKAGDFTRRFVVLEMANTDAAHVAAERAPGYAHLLGQDPVIQFSGMPTQNTVAEASVRQIAWELDATLVRDHPDLLPPT